MTGKAKELFEEWLQCNLHQELEETLKPIMRNGENKLSLSDLPSSMQWGVRQDFYDSQGMEMWVEPCGCHNPSLYEWQIFSHKYTLHEYDGDFKTRQEARETALLKANKLLNERLKP